MKTLGLVIIAGFLVNTGLVAQLLDEPELSRSITELGTVKAYEWTIPAANEFCSETSDWISGAGGGPIDTKTYSCDKQFHSSATDVLADPSTAKLEYGSIEALATIRIVSTNYYATCTYSRQITARSFSWVITLKASSGQTIALEHTSAIRTWLLSRDLFESCKRLAPWATQPTVVVINRVVR